MPNHEGRLKQREHRYVNPGRTNSSSVSSAYRDIDKLTRLADGSYWTAKNLKTELDILLTSMLGECTVESLLKRNGLFYDSEWTGREVMVKLTDLTFKDQEGLIARYARENIELNIKTELPLTVFTFKII